METCLEKAHFFSDFMKKKYQWPKEKTIEKNETSKSVIVTCYNDMKVYFYQDHFPLHIQFKPTKYGIISYGGDIEELDQVCHGMNETKTKFKDEDGNFAYKLEEKIGDLFDANTPLCHCVSEDFRMGRGIAVHFRQKFGQVEELKRQQKKTGQVAILTHERHTFIYNLVTKKRANDLPTYTSLYNSLLEMKNHCLEHNVKEISMPAIGCGLDGLKWPRVKYFLNKIFSDTNIQIFVYFLKKKE